MLGPPFSSSLSQVPAEVPRATEHRGLIVAGEGAVNNACHTLKPQRKSPFGPCRQLAGNAHLARSPRACASQMRPGSGFQRSAEKVLQEDFSRFDHLVLVWLTRGTGRMPYARHSEPSARVTLRDRFPLSTATCRSHGLQHTSQSCTSVPATSTSTWISTSSPQ